MRTTPRALPATTLRRGNKTAMNSTGIARMTSA